MSKAMSITEQYWVASTARSKLSKAAAQTEHNLRLLVGHANLLDNLMEELNELKRLNSRIDVQRKQHTALETVEEELLWESESDDEFEDEPPERDDNDDEELSLNRWPSYPPTTIQVSKAAESTPQIQIAETTVRVAWSARFLPALDSIVEEAPGDVEEPNVGVIGRESLCAFQNREFLAEEGQILETQPPNGLLVDERSEGIVEVASAILGALSGIQLDSPGLEAHQAIFVAC